MALHAELEFDGDGTSEVEAHSLGTGMDGCKLEAGARSNCCVLQVDGSLNHLHFRQLQRPTCGTLGPGVARLLERCGHARPLRCSEQAREIDAVALLDLGLDV